MNLPHILKLLGHFYDLGRHLWSQTFHIHTDPDLFEPMLEKIVI